MEKLYRSVLLLAPFFLAACQSTAPFTGDITTFGQGVSALEGANDALGTALSNQIEATREADFATHRTKLDVLNCATLAGDPCVAVAHGTNPPDLSDQQKLLVDSKRYLELVRNYANGLSALAGSADFASASKNVQAIGTSLGGVASAVGNNSAAAKAAALSASGGVNGFLGIGAASLSEWQVKKLQEIVADADEPIQQISDLVASSFQASEIRLVQSTDPNFDQHIVHILDSGYGTPIPGPEYKKQLTPVMNAVDRVNLIRAANGVEAAKQLGVAHEALNKALQGNGSLADAWTALDNFSIAASRAQTVFQQLAAPVGSAN